MPCHVNVLINHSNGKLLSAEQEFGFSWLHVFAPKKAGALAALRGLWSIAGTTFRGMLCWRRMCSGRVPEAIAFASADGNGETVIGDTRHAVGIVIANVPSAVINAVPVESDMQRRVIIEARPTLSAR